MNDDVGDPNHDCMVCNPSTIGAPGETSDRLIDRDGRVLSLKGLDYVGECIVDLERRLAENDALLDAAIERAKRRAETLAAPLKAELERRKGQVAAYLQQHREETIPKGKKTRELPSGLVVGFRAQQAGYRWDQKMKPAEREAALLAWARVEEDATGEVLAEATWKPDLTAIKRHLGALDSEERAESFGRHRSAPPGLEYVPDGSEEMVINVKERA